MTYALIMAGGSGTRLWPLSRQDKPKQFQSFLGKETLIQQTFNRIKPLFKPSQIFVSTLENYRNIVITQLKEVSPENIICEPLSKNTAPSIGLAALLIVKRDPNALIAVIPSDHYVGKEDNLRDALESATAFLRSHRDYLVTLGINPTEPNTGYGYIKIGEQLTKGKNPVFKVEKFHEKPDYKTAQRFFKQWNYLWNGGFFIFYASHLLALFKKYLPKTYEILTDYLNDPKAGTFQKLTNEPIDKAIAEKVKNLAVLPVDLNWSDLGTWSTLQDVLSRNGQLNKVTIGHHIGLETDNSLIFSHSKLVATLGVTNLIVVYCDDAILICDRDRAQDVKKLVDLLKEQGRVEYI